MKKIYFSFRKLKSLALGAALMTTGGLSAQLTTLDFQYTGSVQTFTVPTCVTAVSVTAYGAEGVSVGNGNFATGKGGMAAGVLTVTPGQVLNIYVGGQNGYNGGGTGQNGGNGGGASDIRLNGTSLADRVIVAGGGGGAGGDNWNCSTGAGHGGGGLAVGTNFVGGGGGAGYSPSTGCGTDGGNAGGSGGTGYHGGGGGGGGFISGGAGANANGGGGIAGTGSLGIGGNSAISPQGCGSEGAGGGGGGYYGGGGAAGTNCGAGRGGGGSSWTGALTSPAFGAGVRFGNGLISIAFPTPSITVVSSNTFACLGQTTTITAIGVSSYTWTGPNGVIALTSTINVNPAVSTIYTVNGISNISNCAFTNTASVIVDNLVMSVTPVSSSICIGASATFTASGADNYVWSSGWPYQSVTITPTTTTTYTVSGTNANNCVISNTVSAVVNPLPNVTASASKTLICKGESVVLTAGGASTYTWTNLGNGASITVTPALNTMYTYSVTGTDANGCVKGTATSIDVKLCTGINEMSVNNNLIDVYPNPSNGSFNIQSDATMNLNVVNQLGQVVKTVSLDTTHKQVTVTGLADGVYFITGESKGSIVNKKVVVTK